MSGTCISSSRVKITRCISEFIFMNCDQVTYSFIPFLSFNRVFILSGNLPLGLNVVWSRGFLVKSKNVTISCDFVKRNEKPGGKSKHHKKNSASSGHKRQRERRPSGSSVSSLSTECSRVSSQGGGTRRHRERHSREHGSSKRRKLHQQQPEEATDHTTLRVSSQVSIH